MKQIYVTTAFKQQIKKQWPDYVLKSLQDAEKDPNFEGKGLHQHNHSYVYFKKYNTEAYPRLVYYEWIDADNDVVLYIPRHFFQNHEEYDGFIKLSKDVQETKYKFAYNEIEEIKNKISQLITPENKPMLPKEMQDFENERDFSNTGRTYIFEMREWMDNIKKPEFINDSAVFKRLGNLVISNDEDKDLKNNNLVSYEIDDKWYIAPYEQGDILYRVYSVSEGNREDRYFYLFDIVKKDTIDIEYFKNKYSDLDSNTLLKQAGRGYPWDLLCIKSDSWKDIETDKDANLVLSEEEVEVLNNKKKDKKTTQYPFFINGLAGSGKSTILYYLYNHIFLKEKEKYNFDLLFVSYSEKLVIQAQKIITSIYKFKHHELGKTYSEDDVKKLTNSIKPFQGFLKNHFLTAEEKSRFEDKNRISYYRFKELYSKCILPEKTSYKPAVVWSVIRSFIKGRKACGYFSPADYNEITDRTVLPEDYKKIYSIFEKWYKLLYEKHNVWDDLDLIRYILTTKSEYKKFDVIYCDEAQDFTPIEINLILKLSKYNDYNLTDFKKIPIAFAGDPNQTVSPTGFSWSKLKNIFTDVFEKKTGICLVETTLKNNYRSKLSIVQFANTLQYIRKCFLSTDDDYLTPQNQWNPRKTILPSYFCSENNDDLLDLVSEKSLCVITGEDGEYNLSSEIIDGPNSKTDKFLNNIQKAKLYTAISSKGMEFPVVVLYNFVDDMPTEFEKIFMNRELSNESERYACTHFLTKLYIAVSRAKDYLFIFDTKDNYQKFWKHFENNDFVKTTLFPSRQDSFNWKTDDTGEERTGGIKQGDKNEFVDIINEEFDPERQANNFFENGLANRDVELMLRAEAYFRMANNNVMAEKCIAYSLKFKHDYKAAGDKFKNLHKPDYKEAVSCYWQGECWNDLADNTTNASAVQIIIARYMIGEKSLIDIVRENSDISESFNNLDDVWQHVVVKIITDVDKIDNTYLTAVCEFLECLSLRGFDNADKIIAGLYFKRKMYKQAADKWEELRNTDHEDYWFCKERIALSEDDHNEVIKWKNKAGKTSDILKNYSKISDIEKYSLNDNSKNIVFLCLSGFGDTYQKAFEYPYEKEDKLNKLYNADKVRFIELYVLHDFSEIKFKEWIEDKLKISNDNVFANPLPQNVFEKIFGLSRREIEMFLYLKDVDGKRVLFLDEHNRNAMTDILAGILKKRYFKIFASYFVDLLFGNDYNFPRAKKYESVINAIISHREFSKKDFRKNEQFNAYFVKSGFDEINLDKMKANLRNYSDNMLSSYKKAIKKDEIESVKNCCYIYEFTVEYFIKDGTTIPSPNFDKIKSFYTKIKGNKIFSQLATFFDMRLKANDVNSIDAIDISEIEKDFNVKQYLGTLTYDDMMSFVKNTIGKEQNFVTTLSDYVISIAEFLYQYDLKISDLEGTRDYIRNNVKNLIDNAMTELLAADTIDTYSLKLLMYLAERGVYGNQVIADKYNKLINTPRLERKTSLTNYLKSRALYFYYWSYKGTQEEKFDEKAQEYGFSMEDNDYSEWKRPYIQHESEVKPNDKRPNLKPFVINSDTTIGKYDIALKANRKTIWISKGDIDYMTIQKGSANIDNPAYVSPENDQTYYIDRKLKVSIISANEILLILDGKMYKIQF